MKIWAPKCLVAHKICLQKRWALNILSINSPFLCNQNYSTIIKFDYHPTFPYWVRAYPSKCHRCTDIYENLTAYVPLLTWGIKNSNDASSMAHLTSNVLKKWNFCRCSLMSPSGLTAIEAIFCACHVVALQTPYFPVNWRSSVCKHQHFHYDQ